MASLEELRNVRLKKLEKLREKGIDPYPAEVTRTHTIADAHAGFDVLEKEEAKVTLVGRIKGLRAHGGSTFIDLEDGTGTVQVFCEEEKLGGESYGLVSELSDLGDFIEVTGTFFVTKQGTRTLNARAYRIITKALRPIPEEYFGLKDTEERLRRRYLDLIANKETRELFRKKAQFWRSARTFFEEHGFIEIDTPALEDVPGGADAAPFVTHHNALDRDFYLRISLELPLKKAVIGGFEKVYEIGKVFRNEGISAEHLQDYLLCEFYWAYADYRDMMGLVESLYRKLVEETTESLTTTYDGKEINWAGEWERATFTDLIKKECAINVEEMSRDELATWAEKNNLPLEDWWGTGRIMDIIWKKKIRPNIAGPLFVIHHPIEVSPLAKKLPGELSRVQRLQVIAAGTELGNGWSELNDPPDQRERFTEQQALREKGDNEAQMKDESFLEALEYGMPPTAGFGFSERLFAVLMDRPVRETVLFPPMRKEEDND